MAKKMRRMLALVLVLAVIGANFVIPAAAAPWFPGGGSSYEWYEVYVQGSLVESGRGSNGDVYYLGTHYVADAYADGHMLYWYIDPQGSDNYFDGQVDLSKYITIPQGYSIDDIEIEEASINGVNDPVYNMYDNAVITITIKALKNESGGVVEVPEETNVAVIHTYYTKDLYTGETVKDGTIPSYAGATEGDTFTATAVPTYNGNTYTQTGATPGMTITVDADASKNVINIDYLRTIDTTPKQTSVTVNHNYYTKDLYTGATVLDGSTTGTQQGRERDVFTATAALAYNGNIYSQTTADAALTITLAADASANVINIDYLRTIDTTPKDTSVTVNHNYYTKDLYTGATVLDGSTTGTQQGRERDAFTAAAVTIYADKAYAQTTDSADLTITLVADASKNVVNIDYLRVIDTTPKKTSVTEYHYYYTWDKYTDETVLDGSEIVVNDATEHDTYTATPILTYKDEPYTKMTNDALLTIKVVADPQKNEVIIGYLRTVDTTPADYAPTVSVVKTADKAAYQTGETITWTVQVTNTSDYPAYNVVVTDELVNKIWIIDTLEPGGFRTFTATSVAAAEGEVKNVVVTDWTDGDEYADEEETDEPKTTSDEETVTVTDPVPPTTESVPPTTESVPPTTQPTGNYDIMVAEDDFYVGEDGLVEIEDEDVPLADVPQTGDMSFLWVALSAVSAGGAVLLNRKRKED